jgi:hypothetical protein
MGGRAAIRAGLAALALAASAACSPSGADRSGPTATVATEAPATTTTTDPYAVPAVIDEAYVNRVLAGLDATRGDATRSIVASRTIPRDAYDRLRAMYGSDQWLQLRLDSLQSDMRRNFAGYAAEPGNQVSTVVKLLTATAPCIFAQVRRDYSAVGPGATASSDRNWVGLRPLDPSRDPAGHNPTSWALVYDGFPEDRSQPPDPCVN